MAELVGRWGVSLDDTALLVLIGVIAALFVVTLVFSGYALVLRGRNRRRDERLARLADRWRGPVLLAVADPEAGVDVHELVAEDEARDFVEFVLEYARRVRGDERASLRVLVEPYLDRVVDEAESSRTEVRAWAVHTLGALGLPDHADTVVRALDDESPLVAMVAARALAREEWPQFAYPVLQRVGRFRGWSPRFLASMLASIGPTAIGALRAGLADPTGEPWVRAVQADALALEGDYPSADVAVEILESEQDHELLAAALRLLGEVGRPEHAAAVRPKCFSPVVAVRAQALHALGSLGGEDDVPTLVAAMDDPSPWAALYAARGLKEAGGEWALRDLAGSAHPTARLASQVLKEEVSS